MADKGGGGGAAGSGGRTLSASEIANARTFSSDAAASAYLEDHWPRGGWDDNDQRVPSWPTKAGLSDDEENAASVYAGGAPAAWEWDPEYRTPEGRVRQTAYKEINPFLRGQAPAPKGYEAQMDEIVAGLDGAIAKGRMPDTIATYRGVHGDFAARLLQAEDNSTFSDKAFTSLSLRPAVAHEYARRSPNGLVMRVVVPKGHPGMSPDAWTSTTFNKQIVLGRNTTFRKVGTHVENGRVVLDVVVEPA